MKSITKENTNSILELILEKAVERPMDIALCFLKDGEHLDYTVTYGELGEKIISTANYLSSLNLGNKNALLLYPTGVDFVATFLGCLLAKVIAIPAYLPRSNRKSKLIHSIVSDSTPNAILTTNQYAAKIDKDFGVDSNCQIIITDILPNVSVHEVSTSNIKRNDIAFLQYTSGSTSAPKGVIVRHKNLLHNLNYMVEKFEADSSSVFASWLPMYHDLGLIGNLLQPLFLGVKCILMSPEAFLQKPFRWLKAISDYRVTISSAPNFAYELCVNNCVDEQLTDGLDLSCLRILANGAEPVRPTTLMKFGIRFGPYGFSQMAFAPCYGMAEATLMVRGGGPKTRPIVKSFDREALKDGCAYQNVSNVVNLVGYENDNGGQDLKIVDPEMKTINPLNKVGEIWLRGESIIDGYWDKELKNGDSFGHIDKDTSRVYFRTGDLGFLDDEGILFITGRSRDLIIIRGKNYYPQDIEDAISSCNAAFRDDASVAFSIEDKDEAKLCLVQEIRKSDYRTVNLNECFESIRKCIANDFDLSAFKIYLVKPYSIPKTSSGKTQRMKCKEMVLGKKIPLLGDWTSQQIAQKIPSDNRIAYLSKSNNELIKAIDIQNYILKAIGHKTDSFDHSILNSSFSDLGLDSLNSIILVSNIENRFRCKLSPLLIYEYPTIAKLTDYIEKNY